MTLIHQGLLRFDSARIPESLGRRLKVHAAQTGQKEKDTLADLIAGYPVEKGA